MKKITRRTALRGTAAVAAVAAVPVAAPLAAIPINQATDEPLQEMERQWLAWRDYCRTYSDESDEARDPLYDRLNEIEFQIHRTPAKSPSGIAVKLRMWGRSHGYSFPGEWWELSVEDFDGDLDHMPIVSALRDAERLAGEV